MFGSIASVKIPQEWFESSPWRVRELWNAGYDVIGSEADQEAEIEVGDESEFEDLLMHSGPADRGRD